MFTSSLPTRLTASLQAGALLLWSVAPAAAQVAGVGAASQGASPAVGAAGAAGGVSAGPGRVSLGPALGAGLPAGSALPGLQASGPSLRTPSRAAMPRAAAVSLPAALPRPMGVAGPAAVSAVRPADTRDRRGPSALRGLMEHGPKAREVSRQEDPGSARRGAALNFRRAAGLDGGTQGPAVSADLPLGERMRIQALTAVSAAADAEAEGGAATQKEVMDQVGKQLGPLLERRDAPILFKSVERIFGRLSVAQQKLFPADVLPLNKVFVVDTPVENAFVYALKSPGVRRMNNLVFVTTGLMRKMFGDAPSGRELKLGETRLAGILAHELAHPIDHAEAEGFSKNHLREVASQAKEVRADAEGMLIAREAGYPAEAVYDGLRQLLNVTRRWTTIQAGASTHPQNFLRLGVQRMLLTLQRYFRGRKEPKYPDALSPQIIQELEGLDKAKQLWTFEEPRTLREAFDRIRRIPDIEDKSVEYKVVEYNRLLLTIDRMLLEKGEDLTEEEWDGFIELNRMLAGEDDLPILDRKGMTKRFTKDNRSLEFLRRPSHLSYVKKIPAYSSERYLEWAKENYFGRTGYGDTDDYMEALVKILPAEHIVGLFEDEIVEGMIGDMRQHGNGRYIYEDALKHMPLELHIRMANLFHRRIVHELKPAERLLFFTDGISDRATYALPQLKYKGSGRGILTERMEFLGDPRRKALQDEYRGTLRAVWENRGYFGTLDVIMEFANTDWTVIFDVLGIDEQAGYSQLRQAVKAFTKTEDYAGVLRLIANGAGGLTTSIRPEVLSPKFRRLPWADDTLAPFLAGDFNERVRGDTELLKIAKANFVGSYLTQAKPVFRRLYEEKLRRAISERGGKGVTLRWLAETHTAALKDIAGKSGARIATFRGVQASLIDESSLSPEKKRELLRAIFLESYGKEGEVVKLFYEKKGDWLNNDEEDPGAILDVLLRNGALENTLELFTLLMSDKEYIKDVKILEYSRHFGTLGRFKDKVLGDLEVLYSRAGADKAKLKVLMWFLKAVMDPGEGRYPHPEFVNGREMREIKNRIAELARGLDVPAEDRFRFFYTLTAHGATPRTDEYFESELGEYYEDTFTSRSYGSLRMTLAGRRLASSKLQLKWTERLLEPEIAILEKRSVEVETVDHLIERINRYVPNGTVKKDDFLESLAWRLGLQGQELEVLIEDEKSYNWKKSNPILVNLGSALTNELTKMSPESRERFMEYLLDTQNRELPPELLRDFERSLYDEAVRKARLEQSHKNKGELRRDARKAAYLMKLQLEAALRDASPFERIPLFELLISGGRRALELQHDYPLNIIRKFLKYEEGSDNEKMLLAFLKVIPAHERSVSLAYMLSQVGEDKSSVKSIFEVFQTVGIKFGQLSSTWKLFGDDVAEETASLKDNARPMTKAEILDAAREQLTEDEFAKIKRFRKIMGSASIKTVVLVELWDGREVVMMVQRPHAVEQINSNLELGKDFVAELRRQGLDIPAALFDSMLEAVREQLAEELKMTAEAKHIAKARSLFAKLNRAMKRSLGGWRFAVPGLVEGFEVRDTIIFVEKAEGVTFDKLSAGAKAQAGPALVEASLRTLFRDGWFDADRHTGNQLIDEKNRVIYVIDFGQAQSYTRKAFWRSDDRYLLSQFVRALKEADPRTIVRYALAMRRRGANADPEGAGHGGAPHWTPKKGSVLTASEDDLRLAVAESLAAKSETLDQLVGVINALAEQGIVLDRKFTFGALKGLITLYGEKYVSDAAFAKLMTREVTRRLKVKALRMLMDSGLVSRIFSGLKSLFAGDRAAAAQKPFAADRRPSAS